MEGMKGRNYDRQIEKGAGNETSPEKQKQERF